MKCLDAQTNSPNMYHKKIYAEVKIRIIFKELCHEI